MIRRSILPIALGLALIAAVGFAIAWREAVKRAAALQVEHAPRVFPLSAPLLRYTSLVPPFLTARPPIGGADR